MPIDKKIILQAVQAALIAVIEGNPLVKGLSTFIHEVYKSVGANPDEALKSWDALTDEDFREIVDQLDITAKNTALTAAGITRVEELIHRLGDELRAESARKLQPAVHQLRSVDADFTGRQADLATIRNHIHASNVAITGLQGMGGIGKTQLALAIAHEIKPQYPDAQILIDMQGYTRGKAPLTASDAMADVINSFERDFKRPESDNQLAAEYISVLNGKRCLLLIDNIRDESQLAGLMPPAGCKLITTTRNTGTFSGLDAVRVDVMTEADAVALLEKITDRVKPLAKEIAAACGYLPLALNVTAHALRTRKNITAKDYLRRLNDEERRVKAFDKVHQAIAVSDDLIEDDELRQRWYALAVFPGDFMSFAPAHVWKLDNDDAVYVLSDLMTLSLIEYDEQTGRYKLHDLVRDYVNTKLTPDTRNTAALRHAEQYKNVCLATDRLYKEGGDNILVALNLFDTERHNIDAGFNWSATNTETSDPAAQLCNAYPDAGAYCLALRQHPREWITWLEHALTAARRLKDRWMEGAHLGNLGLAYFDLGETKRAIEYHEQALAISREIGDRRGEGNALGNLGLAYYELGETKRAIEYHKKDLAIRHEIGDRRGEGNALGNLGLAYADLGETKRAIECYEQIFAIFREIGDRLGEANASWNLGDEYRKPGEYFDLSNAIAFMQVSVDFYAELGHPTAEARTAYVAALRQILERVDPKDQPAAIEEATQIYLAARRESVA